MKLAVINPTPYAHSFMWGLGYHLVLAQKLLVDRDYREWYRDNRDRGLFVIVDNGAAESDTPPFTEVLRVADYIGADEVVLPDKVNDMDGTLGLLADSRPLWEQLPVHQRFVVPQGRTYDEWFNCFNLIRSSLEFSTIGVSKYFPRLRAHLVGRLGKELAPRYKWHVHLLGVVGHPVDELSNLSEECPWVRGIDTGAPVAWAQEDRRIDEDDTRRSSLRWGRPCKGTLAEDNTFRLQRVLRECR